ncbi:TPA: glycoside hydrolase family 92 protein, partial [Staphylococcus aureus]|nr:glycoside hydrolase family 92 protein [Staphylococcus aureus]
EHTKTFYHTLYRTFLFPQTFYELDENQQPIHYDTFSQTVRPGVLYTNNGFWDTYKTVYPLFSLIAQEKYEEMLEGFLNSYNETGFLPKWLSPDERGLMPGTLIDAVIADAAVKKIRPDLMPQFL